MPLPIVFVPGMLCDERLFRPQLDALRGARLMHVADLRQDASIEAMARRALRTAPAGPFMLAGLSLGGIVAMEVMRIAPGRVAALVLMATNHRAATDAFRMTRRRQLARASAGHFRAVIVEEFKSHYLAPCHADNQPLRETILDMALTSGPAVFEAQSLALMARSDQSATLAQCQCPTLLIAGADDRLCPVATHQDMASLIPRAELVVLPQAGHILTLEQPGEVTHLLAAFVR